MTKRNRTNKEIDKELETADINDFDTTKAVFINEQWNLEKTYPLNIRLNKGILAEAKVIAKEKGIPYQTLLKLYIADGIRHDLKALAG
ncbi:MAG: CopG family antitoxin [Candidatus Hydrogenedentota bacterium]